MAKTVISQVDSNSNGLRYQSPETLKFKFASEIITPKQLETETVDEFITKMRKLAKLCDADAIFVERSR